MPGVESEGPIEAHGTALGMVEGACEVGVGEGREQEDPAGVESFEKLKRKTGRCVFGVGEFGPGFFAVGFDERRIFGEGEAETRVAVQVAIGDVVEELTHGPAVRAIGCVELPIVKAVGGFSEARGKRLQGGDPLGSGLGGDGFRRLIAADGVTEVEGGRQSCCAHGAGFQDTNRVWPRIG